MGLNFPEDLGQWRHWQQNRNRLRKLRGWLRKPPEEGFVLGVRGEAPEVLIALDAATPTQRMSLLAPLASLESTPAAILAPAGLQGVGKLLPDGHWQWSTVETAEVPAQLHRTAVVVAVGHYLRAGALAHEWSQRIGARFDVVQHGLLTPHAPPLPRDAHLLAFSEADAVFWRSGRSDVTSEVVGSQLLWTAQAQPAPVVDPDGRPVFLGQLHGAELPRSQFARAAREFCQATGALYRPHPSETDRLSRIQHALWESRGITINHSGTPLATLAAPVASVFSTGILEAAARGVPAWATHPDPPVWLQEFWERYCMSQWGQEPTLAPAHPRIEPALAIAQAINRQLGGT